MLNAVPTRSPRELFNQNCDLLSLFVFLKDHKAATLTSVVDKVKEFALDNNNEEVKFLLAAGNAGIEATTNIVVEKSMKTMVYVIYAVTIVMCYITSALWQR
jgi:predicted RND superfamily exporter protein